MFKPLSPPAPAAQPGPAARGLCGRKVPPGLFPSELCHDAQLCLEYPYVLVQCLEIGIEYNGLLGWGWG